MYYINCIADLVEHLYEKKSCNDKKGRKLYFRGESKDYGDSAGTPSIGRNNRLLKEHNIFRECERRLPDEFKNCKTTFERLVNMQHYRIPTRLLDVSLDPLIALFFSVYDDPLSGEDTSDVDASVLIYSVPKNVIKSHCSDAVSCVSNIAVYSHDNLDIRNFSPDYENGRKGFNKQTSIQYLLHEIKAEKSYFSSFIDKKTLESVFCVHPLLDNPRVKMQQGAFLLFGIDGTRESLAKLDSTNIDRERLIVPSKAKHRIKEELFIIGKTVDTVFPDWVGVSDYLGRFWNL